MERFSISDFEGFEECEPLDLPECEFCGSIDVIEFPSGAIRCNVCRTITITEEEREKRFFEPDWFLLLDAYQRAAVMGERVHQPCISCGLETTHSALCREINANWFTMPWGKHKGLNVMFVPTDYLEFIGRRGYGRSDTKAMIKRELARRGIILEEPPPAEDQPMIS